MVTSGPDAGRSHPLTPGRHVVGRDPGAALRLSDPQISRRDFTLVATGVPGPPAPDGTGGTATTLELEVDPGTGRTNELRLNGRPITGPAPLRVGDDLQAGTTTFRLRGPLAPPRAPRAGVGSIAFERTPQFHQPVAPRVFEPLGRVPARPEPRRFQVLTFVAPLAMGLAMAYLFQSPRYLLFAVLSPVVAIGNYVDSRRSGTRKFKRGCVEFRERLTGRRQQLAEALAAERRLRHRNSPDPAELVQQALTHSKSLWNRTRFSPDFLDLRVGLGSVPARIVVKPELQGDEDLRLEAETVQAAYSHLADVPVTLNLATAGGGGGGGQLGGDHLVRHRRGPPGGLPPLARKTW